ncbi:MAG: hypothetical protein ACK4NX_02270, partial [Candidatus Paceibacteria bacterium]
MKIIQRISPQQTSLPTAYSYTILDSPLDWKILKIRSGLLNEAGYQLFKTARQIPLVFIQKYIRLPFLV